METNKNNQDLLRKIHDKLKTEKPHSRWHGRLIAWSKISSIIVLFLLSSFTLSLFLHDVGEKTSIYEFTNSPVIENTLNFLVEFLVISLLGIAGIYAIYRRSDWPLVKERLGLLTVSFVCITAVSVSVIVFSANNANPWGGFIGDITHRVRHTIPLRSYFEEREEKDLEANSYFSGTVTFITSFGKNIAIIVDNGVTTKTFLMQDLLAPIKVGDTIILQYEGEGATSSVQRIKILR